MKKLLVAFLAVLFIASLGSAVYDEVVKTLFVQDSAKIGTNVTVGNQLLVAGSSLLHGNTQLGNATTDVITPTGYFTYARIGTGSTFANIGSVGADELGVEGQAEIDGAVFLNNNVTLGNNVADVITPTGYLTYARIGTGTTFGEIGAVGADELGVEGAAEIDGVLYADGGITVLSGQNILRGTYSVPAARDSAENTKPLIQYGSKKVLSGQTINFVTEGLSKYTVAPKVVSLIPLRSDLGDSTYTVFPTAVTDSSLTVGITLHYDLAAVDSTHTSADSLTVHYVLIGS